MGASHRTARNHGIRSYGVSRGAAANGSPRSIERRNRLGNPWVRGDRPMLRVGWLRGFRRKVRALCALFIGTNCGRFRRRCAAKICKELSTQPVVSSFGMRGARVYPRRAASMSRCAQVDTSASDPSHVETSLQNNRYRFGHRAHSVRLGRERKRPRPGGPRRAIRVARSGGIADLDNRSRSW